MGNMSNPSINRWGLNLFWYRFWFTDKNYYLNLQYDRSMIKLVYIFLNFGLLFPVNIFINKYWYKKIKNNNYFNNHNTKYYRIINFKNFITKEISHYNERIKIENIYQSKIWILKFQNWIIINFYCFNPIKKREMRNNKFYKKIGADIYTWKKSYNLKNYKRIKLIIFFFLKNFLNKKNYYIF